MSEIKNGYEIMYNNIVAETTRYMEKADIKALVLGLSGGIDSALTAAIARKVCDTLGIKLVGLSMPILTNKPEEILCAEKVGNAFCDEFRVVDLSQAYHTMYSIVAPAEELLDMSLGAKIRRGNIKARLRMITLYDAAHRNKGLVLSTDNYSELMLGFWTICGDVGDWGAIQQLWKTEVYGMAGWLAKKYANNAAETHSEVAYNRSLALSMAIAAIPTDGLGVTNSDFDQLGVDSYEKIDKILATYIATGESAPECPVIRRHRDSQFKRDIPINIPREVIINGVL